MVQTQPDRQVSYREVGRLPDRNNRNNQESEQHAWTQMTRQKNDEKADMFLLEIICVIGTGIVSFDSHVAERRREDGGHNMGGWSVTSMKL